MIIIIYDHLYCKNFTIVNDTSRVVRMILQVGAPLIITILMTLEVSLMLPELSVMLQENIIVQTSLMMIVIYGHHIFIVRP